MGKSNLNPDESSMNLQNSSIGYDQFQRGVFNLSATISTAKKKRILVIDDEPSVRRVIQYCLEDLAGWTTEAVGSGQEGLTLAITQPFDAIVLDLMMPGMDGLMFLKALRSHPDAPDLLVILLTAKSAVSLESLFDLDVAGIIEKPFDPIQLPIQIAQLLNWMPIGG